MRRDAVRTLAQSVCVTLAQPAVTFAWNGFLVIKRKDSKNKSVTISSALLPMSFDAFECAGVRDFACECVIFLIIF